MGTNGNGKGRTRHEDLQDIEERLRTEFPPERLYDLMIRQAARTELAHAAAEHAADETVRLGARVDRIEGICPKLQERPIRIEREPSG